jgi:phage-related protein
MEDKPIDWIGTSRDDICSFPDDAKRKAGFELRKIQQGEEPTDF